MKVNENLYMYPEQGMMDANTYIIRGDPGVIIDAGSSRYLPSLIGAMRKDGIEPEQIGAILNTHLHEDHCGANEEFKKFSGATIALHPVQKANYDTVVVKAAQFFGMPPGGFTEDKVLEGDVITVGDLVVRMVTAPGHSPDSVCYFLEKDRFLICGDVLFDHNTGRTDLPGGGGEALKASIENLARLNAAALFPGHMGPVIGEEQVKANFDYIRSNVFPWL